MTKQRIRRFLHCTVLLALLIGMVPAHPAHATAGAIVVTPNADDRMFGNNLAECTLREAIWAINRGISFDGCVYRAGVSEIFLPTGNFQIRLKGVGGEDRNLSGDLDITRSMTLRGMGPDKTKVFVDRSKAPTDDRIFHIVGRMDGGKPSLNVEISNLEVRGGIANDKGGGAILVEGGNLTVEGVRFIANTASGSLEGGAIKNTNGSTLSISTSIFEENEANFGGAIYNESMVYVRNSLFAGNKAFTGGGLDNDPTNRKVGYAVIENSTFAENEAIGEATGAGINNSGKLDLTNATIARNEGYGLMLNGDATSPYTANIRNTIVAEHAGKPGCAMQNPNTRFVTGGYNLVDRTNYQDPLTFCPFNAGGLRPDILNVPAGLGSSLTHDQGSVTRVYMIMDPNSAAVDAIPESDNACLPTDQLLHGRPVDGNKDGVIGCDIGAHELGGYPRSTDIFFPIIKR